MNKHKYFNSLIKLNFNQIENEENFDIAIAKQEEAAKDKITVTYKLTISLILVCLVL